MLFHQQLYHEGCSTCKRDTSAFTMNVSNTYLLHWTSHSICITYHNILHQQLSSDSFLSRNASTDKAAPSLCTSEIPSTLQLLRTSCILLHHSSHTITTFIQYLIFCFYFHRHYIHTLHTFESLLLTDRQN